MRVERLYIKYNSIPTDIAQNGFDLSAETYFPKNDLGQAIDKNGDIRTVPWSIGCYEGD